MAAIGKRRKHHKAVGKRRKTARRNVVVVGKRRRSRRVSGTGIGSTHHHKRKRRRSVGALGGGKVMQVVEMAAGVAAGALVTHMALRPLEHKISQHAPMVKNFMGAAEIALGGFIALKAKSNLAKSFGVGILAGGVHTVMHQAKIGVNSPAVSGMDDMSVINVPINGDLRATIEGLIDSDRRYVRTPVVGVLDTMGPVRTPVVGDFENEGVSGHNDDMGDLTEAERDFLYAPRGY